MTRPQAISRWVLLSIVSENVPVYTFLMIWGSLHVRDAKSVDLGTWSLEMNERADEVHGQEGEKPILQWSIPEVGKP